MKKICNYCVRLILIGLRLFVFGVFLKTEAPFFLLPALGGCAPQHHCIFGHGAPPLAHQCKKIVGRNISLQLAHAPELMLFHMFDALVGNLTPGGESLSRIRF